MPFKFNFFACHYTEGKCSLRDESGQGKTECSPSDEFIIMHMAGEEDGKNVQSVMDACQQHSTKVGAGASCEFGRLTHR